MNKGKKILLLIVGFLVLASVIGLILVSSTEQDRVNRNVVVEVVDGKSNPESFDIKIEISKPGNFYFDIKFWPEEDIGYVTGVRIIDPNGEIINAVTGNKLWFNGPDLKLEKGTYTFAFDIITDSETFVSFVKENIPDAADDLSDEFEYKDGTWSVDYNVSLARTQNSSVIAITVMCALFGIVLGLVVVTLFNNDGKQKAYYDERQRIERYRSGFFGFNVMIGLLVLWGLLDIVGIDIPAQDSAICFTIVAIGLLVVEGVGIWNDGYFALNQNKRGLKIFFSILGVSQLALGIIGMMRGAVVENGVLTNRVITFELGLVLVFLVAISAIKDAKDSEEEEE